MSWSDLIASFFQTSADNPQAWNRLPAAIRHIDCVASFKRQLKTVLFMEAYCVHQ